jgi:hypothetical protein
MKNILLFLIGAFSCLQAFAQDPNPDLFQTWYLYQIDFEGGQQVIVESFDPPIIPTFILEPSLEFNGFGACNTFEGLFTFFPPDSFEVASESHTTTSCGFFLDQFEVDYFSFFDQGTFMISNIETDSDGYQTLYLTGGIFTTCTFRNIPVLATPEFQQPDFSVHPNPVKNELFIASENIPIELIKVYSISGSQVMEVSSDLNFLDVSNLSEGIYFIEIFSSEGSSIQKFIKY